MTSFCCVSYFLELYYSPPKKFRSLCSFMQSICLENNAFFRLKIKIGFVVVFLWMHAYLIITEFKQQHLEGKSLTINSLCNID